MRFSQPNLADFTKFKKSKHFVQRASTSWDSD